MNDPIGITGWPKEKGRDGERTPMQWTPQRRRPASAPTPHTWLPVPPNYNTDQRQNRTAEPDSLLNWHKRLIALRRTNAALHDGGMVMLDPTMPAS